DRRFAKHVSLAQSSIEKGNPAYAAGLCDNILQKYPACAEVRKLLHIANKRIAGKPNPLANALGVFGGLVYSAKAKSLAAKGELSKALSDGEEILKGNPYNVGVLNGMAKVCEGANYWSTAALCYADISEFQPKNIKNMLALGRALVKAEKPDDAMRVGEAVLRADPANGEAQNLMREASVVKTMLKDKWENEGSFKDLINNAAETAQREAENRLANDENSLEQMIEREREKIKKDPENVNLYKDICQHLRALKRYAEALEFIKLARQQPLGKADTSLEKLEQDMFLADLDMRVNAAKAAAEANPSDAAAAKNYEDLRQTAHSFRLENAKKMVERYPNDYNYRFILGNLYLDDNLLDEAIAQFQLSQRNPKVRGQSLLGLGRAFVRGKKYDLAVDQLETAKRETITMNEHKKEIIYELARAYELMGSPDKAFIEYKEIYSSDIGYRDVAAKINAYYENKNK
ncbi:MAG: tetratricopeptide repeat protein, partial [Opitutales bacterium]|nr:tetratricopeptide repeat protein [Opitutales bacterium]